MPVMEVKHPDGGTGYRWGQHGKIFRTKKEAEEQEAAAYANGYTGDAKLSEDGLQTNKIVFDEASRRTKDENGYLHISRTHLTKEQVAPYLGKEIPGWAQYGLDPEKVYFGYRSAKELEKSKNMYNGVPLLFMHKQDSAWDPQKALRCGSIGTTPIWDPPYLDNAMTITDAGPIKAVEDGTCDGTSGGYYFDPDFTPGEFNGAHYDFVMTNMRGNHVSLVEKGRAGPDVTVHDGLPPELQKSETNIMAAPEDKNTKDINAKVDDMKKEDGITGDDNEEIKAKMKEMGLDPEDDKAVKAFTCGMKCAAPVGDEDTETKEEDKKEDKKEIAAAIKEDDKKEEKKDDKKEPPAMDAALIRKQVTEEVSASTQKHFRSLYDAATRVKSFAGELDAMAFDSAEDIYGHVLKQFGEKPESYPKEAWQGMVDMLMKQKSNPIGQKQLAMDSATPAKLDGKFAGLSHVKINN